MASYYAEIEKFVALLAKRLVPAGETDAAHASLSNTIEGHLYKDKGATDAFIKGDAFPIRRGTANRLATSLSDVAEIKSANLGRDLDPKILQGLREKALDAVKAEKALSGVGQSAAAANSTLLPGANVKGAIVNNILNRIGVPTVRGALQALPGLALTGAIGLEVTASVEPHLLGPWAAPTCKADEATLLDNLPVISPKGITWLSDNINYRDAKTEQFGKNLSNPAIATECAAKNHSSELSTDGPVQRVLAPLNAVIAPIPKKDVESRKSCTNQTIQVNGVNTTACVGPN